MREMVVESLNQNGHIFRAALSAVKGGRKLFRTAKNLFGLGPKSAEKGDAICLFSSSKIPFILRPIADDQYELIEEAYLHGYMHGEWKEKNIVP